MLFYCSLHPEWDYSSDSPQLRELTGISSLLEIVAAVHPRNTAGCLDELERTGIFLGDGGFLVIRAQSDPFGDLTSRRMLWAEALTAAAKDAMPCPLWYCFSVSGSIYLLLCYPRLREHSPEAAAELAQVRASLEKMSGTLLSDAPAHRLMASDFQFGSGAVFRCFNTIRHASDYHDFLTRQDHVILLDTESQLHHAFADDLSIYRQFSGRITEMFLQNVPPEDISTLICDRILENSATTIESVHHHVQLFSLTFMDFLGSSGVVDTSYLLRQRIGYRVFQFERESDFRQNFLELIQELTAQNRVLRSVGRQQQILEIRDYIAGHISDSSLSLDRVSEHFGRSTAQISKQFHSYFGITPYRFLQQLRLSHAQDLLKNHRELSIRQVAEQSGYIDLSTMYRAFHKYGSTTPSVYRETTAPGTEFLNPSPNPSQNPNPEASPGADQAE